MIVQSHPVTDRETWLKWRQADVTASDVAAVFGLHPWKTPLQLWSEQSGVDVSSPETAAMRRGRWLEDAVIAACRDHHPDWQIEKPGVYLRAPDFRIGATPDAIAGNVAIQCKTVADRSFRDSWGDGPPVHYQMQALTEAMMLNADRAILAVLVISPYGADYHEFDVPRHPAAEARIKSAVPEFWRTIERGDAPKAQYVADADLLTKLHAPDAEKPPIDLTGDNRIQELLGALENFKEGKAAAEDMIEGIKAEIVEKLAGATIATLPGWQITHKMQTRKETVMKASTFPVLRITRKQEEKAA